MAVTNFHGQKKLHITLFPYIYISFLNWYPPEEDNVDFKQDLLCMPIIKPKMINNNKEEKQSWTNSDMKAVHQWIFLTRDHDNEITKCSSLSLQHYSFGVCRKRHLCMARILSKRMLQKKYHNEEYTRYGIILIDSSDLLEPDNQQLFYWTIIKIWKSYENQQQICNLIKIIVIILSYNFFGFRLMRIQCNIIPIINIF